MPEIWRWFLVATGIAACPCHFPVTLPLVIGAIGATGVGALLVDYSGWVYAAGWAYFVTALAVGILRMRSSKRPMSSRNDDGASFGLRRTTRARPASSEQVPE